MYFLGGSIASRFLPFRLEFAGAIYHLTGRGNARQKVFFTVGNTGTDITIITFDSDESSNLWTQFEGRLLTNWNNLVAGLGASAGVRAACHVYAPGRKGAVFYRAGSGAGPEKILNNSISSASRGVS